MEVELNDFSLRLISVGVRRVLSVRYFLSSESCKMEKAEKITVKNYLVRCLFILVVCHWSFRFDAAVEPHWVFSPRNIFIVKILQTEFHAIKFLSGLTVTRFLLAIMIIGLKDDGN